MQQTALTWIPLFPLIGFLVNGLWYLFGQTGTRKPVGATLTGIIASTAIFASFVCSLYLFLDLRGLEETGRVIEATSFSWMKVAELDLPVTLRVDALSILFCLVITGVGTLIHIYSIGYMGHDETPGKFFAYLNLFCFAMLVLVTGGSLPLLFLGWEGVGLCSYLLIGYWYDDIEKAKAGKKAFIANRVGDLGFLLGMFFVFTTFGTLDFVQLKTAVMSIVSQGTLEVGIITTICLLFFVGCTGKSAQIPLYVWLPDAMAGPTPVSALIHAATMVTSGIYLVSRLSFMFSLSPTAMAVVAWIGALTALFAATIAVAQNDIKKVLAYSTVSQLGYMFLACGVGAYGAGVFHVITHAFFKALLFLGAGSVIYGMHHEQDIMKMGGLKKAMPKTFAVFGFGWLAICGIPPFSGFFSKDEILWMAFGSDHGSTALWAIGAGTAVMTAFYMTRLFSLTFLGKQRSDVHAHETPNVMVAPLAVLAALSLLGGFMGIPHASWLGHWLEPIVGHHVPLRSGVEESMEWVLMGLSVLGAVIGIGVALKVYAKLELVEGVRRKWAGLLKLLQNKWFVDEVYEATIIRPLYGLSKALWTGFDVAVIDRMVVGVGRASAWTGSRLRTLQTGSIQVYAFMILLGILVTLGRLVYGIL